MVDKIGVLLVEEPDTRVGVQLFADPDAAEKVFSNLKGHPGDKPSRATFIKIDYAKRESSIEVRDLPELPDMDNPPDGYRLGEGPVWLTKEKDDKKTKKGA